MSDYVDPGQWAVEARLAKIDSRWTANSSGDRCSLTRLTADAVTVTLETIGRQRASLLATARAWDSISYGVALHEAVA